MNFGIQLVTNPKDEPLTLAEAKAHLRVDFDAEDTLILSLIHAARETVEGKLRRSVFSQTWRMTLDQFPYPVETLTVSPSERDEYLFPSIYYSRFAIRLPRTKVTAVSSITLQDVDNSTVTLDPATYVVDTNSEPARIVPINGGGWPYVASYLPGSIAITFTAGEWDSKTVPVSIKQAMLLLMGHWYANREAVTEQNMQILPLAVDSLLERWKYYGP